MCEKEAQKWSRIIQWYQCGVGIYHPITIRLIVAKQRVCANGVQLSKGAFFETLLQPLYHLPIPMSWLASQQRAEI